jgi:hypothetical protein
MFRPHYGPGVDSVINRNECQEYFLGVKFQKVAGSIPDDVSGFFFFYNPSDRTMAPGSTQPLTEMSTRSISWG